MTDRVYIIAEAGVNHNGSLKTALELCDAAAWCGVDAVKFQTWKTEKIITRTTAKAAYQDNNVGKEISQFDMLKALELSYEDFRTIKEHCDSLGIQFLSTGDNPEDIDFLCSLGMPVIKLGSGDITNVRLLRHVGSLGKPVILSTGMSDMDQVRMAYNTLKEAGAEDITVLHCTTNYPTPLEDVNLNAMLTIKRELGCPVGYSDHTMGIRVPVIASALGAQVIEKHFTLSRNQEGPDHKASLEKEELSEMVREIRELELILGDGVKKPSASEKEICGVVLKKIVAAVPIRKGEILTEDKLAVKRSPSGVSAAFWDVVTGSVAERDYAEDEGITMGQ